MPDFILTASEGALLLAPPAETADFLIDLYRQPATRDQFREDIAAVVSEVRQDPEHVMDAVRRLFDTQNDNLEHALKTNLSDHKIWTPLGQPRILSQSALKLTEIKKGINQTFQFKPRQPLVKRNAGQDSAVFNILCEAFWLEVQLVRDSELALSNVEAYKLYHDINNPDLSLDKRKSRDKYFDKTSSSIYRFASQENDEWFFYFFHESQQQAQQIMQQAMYDLGDGTEDTQEFVRNLSSAIERNPRRISAERLIEFRRDKCRAKLNSTIMSFKDILMQENHFTFSDRNYHNSNSAIEKDIFASITNTYLEEGEQFDPTMDYPALQDGNFDVNGRLNYVDEFVRHNPGVPVSTLIRELFPLLELAIDNLPQPIITLPSTAPKIWDDKIFGAVGPAQFIMDVYGEWMGKGLTLAHIRQLDRPLYDKFNGWKRTHSLPEGFDLPTKSAYHDRALQSLSSGGLPATQVNSGTDLQQFGKLAAAKHYRDTRK